MLDADNNFELVEEINNATLEMEPVSVNFSDYTGNGHRIAFRNVLKGKRYEYSYNYLDDIHIDLTANVAPTKSVSDMTEEADAAEYLERITVYPNPTTDVINVQCTMDNVHCSGIEVIDVYGKVVRTVVGANNDSPMPIRINVSGLANGMYFVRVTTDEGVVTKTFIKR